MRWIYSSLVVLALGGTSAATEWGPRVGLSSNPDQVFVGLQFDAGDFARNVRFMPSAQFGFGDDWTILQGAGGVHYEFNQVNSRWVPYAGGELSFNYIKFDLPDDLPPGFSVDDDDFELGLAAAGGVQTRLSGGSLLLLELRLELTNQPDIQVHAGWLFGGGSRSSASR